MLSDALKDVYVELGECLKDKELASYLDYFVIHPVLEKDNQFINQSLEDFKTVNVSVTPGTNEGYIVSVDCIDEHAKLHPVMWGKTLCDIDTALQVSNTITKRLYT